MAAGFIPVDDTIAVGVTVSVIHTGEVISDQAVDRSVGRSKRCLRTTSKPQLGHLRLSRRVNAGWASTQ